MSNHNLSLAKQVSDAIKSNDVITINNASLKAVKDSLVEFNLQADDAIDVKRLPKEIINLNTFLDHLRGIKGQIEADNLAGNSYQRDRQGHIEGTRPSYMLDGSLKRYKLGVCCLHAISTWSDSSTTVIGPLRDHIDSCFGHASSNPPEGLGTGGAKLWTSTFSPTAPRTKVFLGLIMGFMTKAPDDTGVAPAPNPPSGPPGPNP